MYLTFELKMIFSVPCFFFKPASWHLLLYQYRSIHFDTHISKEHSLFHVPLLYFEHLPLQRSLHGSVRPSKGITPLQKGANVRYRWVKFIFELFQTIWIVCTRTILFYKSMGCRLYKEAFVEELFIKCCLTSTENLQHLSEKISASKIRAH